MQLLQRMHSVDTALEMVRLSLTAGVDVDVSMAAVRRLADQFDRDVDDAVWGAGRAFVCEWERLGFRSKTERSIAQALDRANVLFAANALVRLGITPDHRCTRESDFLVIDKGRLGVLEVDGPFHADTAADDHERDRRFREHGIRVVERYPAERCHHFPDDVVTTFLELLRLNG